MSTAEDNPELFEEENVEALEMIYHKLMLESKAIWLSETCKFMT